MSGAVIAAEIKAALGEAGEATGSGKLTFTITRPGTIDESTYPPTHGTPETFTFTGIIGAYSDRDRAGTNIREGEVRLTLDAGNTEIQNDDTLVAAGRTYHIEAIAAMRVGGVVLMWKIRAKGA